MNRDSGYLRVNVRYANNGMLLPNANVFIDGITAKTGNDGKTESISLISGKHTVFLSAVGFIDKEYDGLNIEENTQAVLNADMFPS